MEDINPDMPTSSETCLSSKMNLWTFLMESIQIFEKTCEVNLTPKAKVLRIIEAINLLLLELKIFWDDCCEPMQESASSIDDDELVLVDGPLKNFFSENLCFKLKTIPIEYHSVFNTDIFMPESKEDNAEDKLDDSQAFVDVKIETDDDFLPQVELEVDEAQVKDAVNEELDLADDAIQPKAELYPSAALPPQYKSKKVFKKYLPANRNNKKYHRKPPKDGPPFACPTCNAKYSQKRTLRLHIEEGKCTGIWKPDTPKYRVIKRRYYCLHPSCVPPDGKLGPNLTSFGSPDYVWNHFAETHVTDQSTNARCDICSKQFPSQELVDLHFKNSHEPKFSCKFCGQACMAKDKLRNHERRHTGEKPYACDQCDFRCIQKNALNAHKKRMHLGDLYRKHMCEQCGKAFFNKTSLQEHILTHTDAKPYSCEMCGKQLRNDSCYRRHMMCVHKIKHTCDECGKDIFSKKGLELHRRNTHGIMS